MLDRGGDLARHERVPAIRADHDSAPDVGLAFAIAQPGAGDPTVLVQEPHDGRGLGDLDTLGTRCPAEQQIVERAAPDREAEAGTLTPGSPRSAATVEPAIRPPTTMTS